MSEQSRPNGADPDREDSRNPNSAITASGDALERLARSFETSAKRWELVVYPSVLAFIVLAVYGFFLIYNVTKDMATLASSTRAMEQTVATMAGDVTRMTSNVTTMTAIADHVSERMDTMDDSMGSMNNSVERVSEHMDHVVGNMLLMTQQMDVMTRQMGQMGTDMSGMHQSVGRPMSFMNNLMPW